MNPTILMKPLLACLLLGAATLSQAMPTSSITFAKGSYCGSYTGDFSKGRLLTLSLGSNQEITIDTDGVVQSVRDSKGNILSDQGEYDYRYVTRNQGKHTIRVIGDGYTSVEVCAY